MSSNYWKNKVGHYVLDGVYFLKDFTPLERVEAVEEYDDIRQDDVIICGYPKAGNHFVADIVKKLRNKGDINKSVKEACDVFLENLVPDVMQYNHEMRCPISLDEISTLKSPRVLNTHLYFEKLPKKAQTGHCKIMHILRDPRDVACSWHSMEVRAMKEMPSLNVTTSEDISCSFHDYMKEFINGTAPYGSWYDHTKGYLNAGDAPHVLLVKYEEIVKDMEEEIRRIARFIERTLVTIQLLRLPNPAALKM